MEKMSAQMEGNWCENEGYNPDYHHRQLIDYNSISKWKQKFHYRRILRHELKPIRLIWIRTHLDDLHLEGCYNRFKILIHVEMIGKVQIIIAEDGNTFESLIYECQWDNPEWMHLKDKIAKMMILLSPGNVKLKDIEEFTGQQIWL